MFDERLKARLALQRKEGLYREPPLVSNNDGRTVTVNGRPLLNFASNDYIGLGRCKRLRQAVAKGFERFGSSSSSSKLVSGNAAVIRDAERAYAEYFGYEDAIFFPSGYQANLSLLSTLFGPEETLVFDKHVHASTVKGMQLGHSPIKSFRHNSMGHLEKRLKGAGETPVVVTESLFSMDGDFASVAALEALKAKHGFLTVVDEAHAVGCLGKKGRGLAGRVADVALGTFGKAMGLFGAFVLLPSLYREYLLNFASPLIYTTALPEAHAVGAMEVLSMVEKAGGLRDKLAESSHFMKARLEDEGFRVEGDAHILAIQIGSETEAQRLVKGLFGAGFFAFSARFPTVPLGQAIIRASLTTHLQPSDIESFVSKLKELSPALANR